MLPYLIAGAIGFVVAKLLEEDEAPKYDDGGSILLAPNGNPSYLTPEQYKLVRSPAFKEWFGDWEKAYETGNYDNISKVIGYNMKGFSGEPLICSHSSYDKFNQFKTPTFFQEGEGGGAYGDTSDEDYVNYNVFLNIKNLLELRGAFLKDKFTPLISEIYKNAGLDDDEYKNRMEFAEKYEDGYGLFKLFEKPYWKNEYGYNWEWVFDYCKKNGYDGFVMRDSDQSMQYYITTWVALYPEQIKLADGTNTTFDGSNPDIRFKDGGSVNELKNYLRNIRLDKDYMENDSFAGDDNMQYEADFGRKGNIVFRVYPDETGNVNSSIYISSIGRRTLDYGIVQGIEGKKDSRGEGAKAIASLFLLYPNVNSVHYEDESYFENEDKSFWEKIGGDSSELFREDFFRYFENKFGYNPDIRFDGGGEIEELKFSNKIESDAMGYDIGDYLYHITPVSNFNTIIKKGFIPKNGISINNKPFENRLYFATSLISAYDLSVNFGSYRDDSEYVIFKIKSDCINDYEEDDLFAHGIYVDYKVSNKCIVGYVNANDLFNKFDDEDIENLYY